MIHDEEYPHLKRNYTSRNYSSFYPYAHTYRPLPAPIPNREQEKRQTSSNEKRSDYFEILGIKLSFDDILIIGLLFFLYTEDVKDITLYIALILLLLS